MRNNPSVQHLCCLLTGKISVFSCGAAAEGLLTQTGLPTGWQGLWGIPARVFRKALLQRDPEKAARPLLAAADLWSECLSASAAPSAVLILLQSVIALPTNVVLYWTKSLCLTCLSQSLVGGREHGSELGTFLRAEKSRACEVHCSSVCSVCFLSPTWNICIRPICLLFVSTPKHWCWCGGSGRPAFLGHSLEKYMLTFLGPFRKPGNCWAQTSVTTQKPFAFLQCLLHRLFCFELEVVCNRRS